MYIKPIEFLSDEEFEDMCSEWGKDVCMRGYDIFDCDNTGLLEINRIDEIFYCCESEVTDEDCAREAERSGFCKIIPVNELPKNFEWKYFGWIDTPENRKNIQKFTEN